MITAGPDASLWKQLVKQWDGRTPSGSVFVHGPVLRRTLRFFERLEELVLEVSAKKNGKPRENVTDLVVELERILSVSQVTELNPLYICITHTYGGMQIYMKVDYIRSLTLCDLPVGCALPNRD